MFENNEMKKEMKKEIIKKQILESRIFYISKNQTNQNHVKQTNPRKNILYKGTLPKNTSLQQLQKLQQYKKEDGKIAKKQLLNDTSLNDQIIITVGNLGYLRLIVNWYRSIQKNTNMAENCCLITYDPKLIDNISQQLPQLKTIYLEFSKNTHLSTEAVSYKNAGWDEITLYKLYAIHYLLSQNKTVYYIDPDVYVLRDSLSLFHEIMQNNPQNRMLIQQGKPFCSGVMYVPPNLITKKLFDPCEWQACGMDDEKYIIDYFMHRYPMEQQYVGVLDLDRFPNGLKWRTNYSPLDVQKQIATETIDLLHFNYISGIENKIVKMQEYGMYLKTMKIVNVPKQFMININDVCMNKNHVVYPPHQKGDQIELFAYRYFNDQTKCEIFTEYDYLPIPWTAIAVENNPKIVKQLKEWLKDFCKKNPQRKCWTIVQHCKGIEIALDIRLPSDWIVFATSDPNAVKIMVITSNKTNPNKENPNKPRKKIANKQIDTRNQIIIPLLSSNHLIESNNEMKPKINREILASFIGDVHVHPIREKMMEVIVNEMKNNELKNDKMKNIEVYEGNYRSENDQNKFKELMQRSVFALCPRGYGNTSYRIVEAMQFGAIPVYISDVFSLPYKSAQNLAQNSHQNEKIDWNSIAVLINENEIGELVKILQSKTKEQIVEYQMNIAKVYEKYFTMQGCCDYILELIENC